MKTKGNRQLTNEEQKFFDQAKLFALAAHEAVGQKRKYTNELYVTHTFNVSQFVKMYVPSHTISDLIASLLHDTVEDTKITLDIIELVFGKEVRDLVDGLTDVSKPEDGNRKVRKQIDKEHTLAQSIRVKNIKLCDILDNALCITKHDPEFAKVWLNEKKDLVFDDRMNDCEPQLLELVRNTINELLKN